MEQITPQEALQIFDQLAANIQGDRASHRKIAQAYELLSKIVAESETPAQ